MELIENKSTKVIAGNRCFLQHSQLRIAHLFILSILLLFTLFAIACTRTQPPTGSALLDEASPASSLSPTPPLIILSFSPAGGTQNADVSARVILTFNTPLDPQTVTPTSFIVNGPNNIPLPGSITSDSTNTIWTFTPTTFFNANTAYTVTITPEVKTPTGTSFPNAVTFSFTTANTMQTSTGGNSGGGATTDTPRADTGRDSGNTTSSTHNESRAPDSTSASTSSQNATSSSIIVGAASPISPTNVVFRNSAGVSLRAFTYLPTTGARPFPAVIMMHGCSGAYTSSRPNANFSNVQSLYNEWGSALARSGFVALLVDSFSGRTSEQNQCDNGENGVSEITDRPLDALAAHNHLVATGLADSQHIGLLGWSHGGSSTMATLSNTQKTQPFRLGVAFYPGCGLYGAFGGTSRSTYTPYAPFKIHHGELDPFYPACATRYDRAVANGARYFEPITLHAGADHTFDYCKTVGGSCSQNDVNARRAADTQVLELFVQRLR